MFVLSVIIQFGYYPWVPDFNLQIGYELCNNLPIHSRYLGEQFLPKQLGYNYIVCNVCAEQETRESSNTNLYAIYYVHELKGK